MALVEFSVACDGNLVIDQGGHGVKFLSHGSKQFAHDLDNLMHWGSDFAAMQRDEKYCTGCGCWKPKERFNAAEPERHTYDSLFPVCGECQRVMFPHTLGLRWCPKCADWLDASVFGADPKLCRRHANEASAERMRRYRERLLRPDA